MKRSGLPRITFPLLIAGLLGCGTSSPHAASGGSGGSSGSGGAPTDAGSDADASDELPHGSANGTVGAWQTLAPMPVKRANFCAAVVGSFVVAIGGNYKSASGFTSVSDVHVAKAHVDGTLDPWTTAGKAPSALTECTVAVSGHTIYLLDGLYDDPTKEGHVWGATLSDAGALGAWADAGALPAGTRLIQDYAWTSGGVVLALHSDLDDTTATLHAPIGATLAPFENAVWLNEFRGAPQWANAAGFAYVLGGYSAADVGNVVLSDCRGAKVNADGTMGASFAVTALPKPTNRGWGVGVDDYVFVLGGRAEVFSGTPRADVLAAKAGADGTLGAWTDAPPLPAGRTNFVAVVAGDTLYALGGAGAEAVDTVYAARVRY